MNEATGPPASERQIHYILFLGNTNGLTNGEIDAWATSLYGVAVMQLTKRCASELIDRLRRGEGRAEMDRLHYRSTSR